MLRWTDFSLQFLPRPKWQDLLNSGHVLDLRAQISADPSLSEDEDAHCVTQLRDRIIGLVIRPHKSTTIIERIIDVIKDGADQCTGQKASVVWLHFVGLTEGIFLSLAEFPSLKGVGLNATVAKVLHSDASSTDRSHVSNCLDDRNHRPAALRLTNGIISPLVAKNPGPATVFKDIWG
jgi:hypothetical protein